MSGNKEVLAWDRVPEGIYLSLMTPAGVDHLTSEVAPDRTLCGRKVLKGFPHTEVHGGECLRCWRALRTMVEEDEAGQEAGQEAEEEEAWTTTVLSADIIADELRLSITDMGVHRELVLPMDKVREMAPRLVVVQSATGEHILVSVAEIRRVLAEEQ